jgi:hypothetical protein
VTAPRIHRFDREHPVAGLVVALCGRLPNAEHARGPERQDEVTCRDCLAKLDAVPFAPGDLQRDEPWTAPPPQPMAVKDSRWGDMPARIRRMADSASRRRERPAWSSVEKAVQHWLAVRTDGYPSPSATASIERHGTTGTRVQSGRRGSSKAARMAEMAAEVETAMDAALESADWPEGVTPRLARAAWLAHRFGLPSGVQVWQGRERGEATVADGKLVPMTAGEVGHHLGLDPATVTVVAHHARRAVHIELAARQLMATPGSLRSRVEVRRRQLLKGRRA